MRINNEQIPNIGNSKKKQRRAVFSIMIGVRMLYTVAWKADGIISGIGECLQGGWLQNGKMYNIKWRYEL
jgi:hypothetical protein